MSSVILFRIDERLIHGQVVTAWIGQAKIKNIVVVDDVSAASPMLTKVLKMASPPDVPVSVYDVKTAAKILPESPENSRILLIVKNPDTAKRLVEILGDGGPLPREINMGNAGKTPQRAKITSNVYLAAEELQSLRDIKAQGYDVYFQTVPGDTRYAWEKVVKV